MTCCPENGEIAAAEIAGLVTGSKHPLRDHQRRGNA
jgi:hypothetical protein